MTTFQEKNLTLEVEGPLGGEDNGVLHYLKRQIEFMDDGLYIMPSKTCAFPVFSDFYISKTGGASRLCRIVD